MGHVGGATFRLTESQVWAESRRPVARVVTQREEFERRAMTLSDFSSTDSLRPRPQPERVAAGRVRKYTHVIETYLKGRRRGKLICEQLRCMLHLMCGNKGEEDVDVRHPAHDMRFVMNTSNTLNVRP